MTAFAELDALVESVRSSGAQADIGVADELAAAVAEWREPVRVQVTGRAGVGKSTVISALGLPAEAETTSIDAPDVPPPVLDGDVVIYVLAERALATDTTALAALPTATVLTVLNKADAISFALRRAVETADQLAAELDRCVLPLVGSLAARSRTTTLTDAEVRSLSRLAETRDVTLTLSPDLFLAADVVTDVRARRTMLERWDMYGIDCAIDTLRRFPELTSRQLTQLMHAASGIGPVLAAVRSRVEQAAAVRGGKLLDTLARLAARSLPDSDNSHTDDDSNGGDKSRAGDGNDDGTGSRARAAIEDFLNGDLAVRVGLAAGLACPEVADIIAEYRSPEPDDPEDALRRADRWRIIADSDGPASGRRAALRIHHGYVRAWERMDRGVAI